MDALTIVNQVGGSGSGELKIRSESMITLDLQSFSFCWLSVMPAYGSDRITQLPYSNISHVYLISYSGSIVPTNGDTLTPLELTSSAIYFEYPADHGSWNQWIRVQYLNGQFVYQGVGAQSPV